MSLIEALVVVVVTSLLALILLPLASRASRRDYDLAARALDVSDVARGERLFRELLAAAAPSTLEAAVAPAPGDAASRQDAAAASALADSAFANQASSRSSFASSSPASSGATMTARGRHADARQPHAPAISGSAREVAVRPVLAQPLACAPAGGGVVVRLRIETDRLVCDRAGTRETLLRWREGRAQLTYAAGPAGSDAWSDVWTPGFATTGTDPSAAPLVRFELDADGRHIVWIAPAGAPDDEARASGEGR